MCALESVEDCLTSRRLQAGKSLQVQGKNILLTVTRVNPRALDLQENGQAMSCQELSQLPVGAKRRMEFSVYGAHTHDRLR